MKIKFNKLIYFFCIVWIAGMHIASSTAATSTDNVSLSNKFMELRFDMNKKGLFQIFPTNGKNPIIDYQSLEMLTEPNGLPYQECNSRLLCEPERYNQSETESIRIVQDWKFFIIEKTVSLSKELPEFILRYQLTAKMDFQPIKDFGIWNYFYGGKGINKIAWETPSGIFWKKSDPDRKELFETNSRGSECGRFVALAGDATDGMSIIAFMPSEVNGRFNACRYEIPDLANSREVRSGFKSMVLGLNTSVQKGDVYIVEWRIRLTKTKDVATDVQWMRNAYTKERSSLSKMKSLLTVPVSMSIPKIDGTLDDPTWADASSIEGFVLPSGGLPEKQTEVKVFASGENLYLGFICEKKDLEKVKNSQIGKDSLLENDSIEVVIAPEKNTKYFHLICDSQGTMTEELCDNWGEGQVKCDNSWTCSWNARVASDEDSEHWTAEMRIPLAKLGLPSTPESRLRINFIRKNNKEISCWSPTYGCFNSIERLGEAIFSDIAAARLCLLKLKENNPGYPIKLLISNSSDRAEKFYLSISSVSNDGGKGATFTQTFPLKPRETISKELNYKALLIPKVMNKLIISISSTNENLHLRREIPLTSILGQRTQKGFECKGVPGIQAWSIYSDNKIFKKDVFEKETDSNEITLDAAKGEAESFQIAFNPVYEDVLLTLSASAPACENDSIPASFIKIYRQKYVTTKSTSDPYGFPDDWPDPLPENNSILAPKGINTAAWISIQVPRDAKPGIYKGYVYVSSQNRILFNIPYTLKIRTFAMPKNYSQIFLAPDNGVFRNQYGMNVSFGFASIPKLINGKIVVPEFETEKFKSNIAFVKDSYLRFIGMTSFRVGSGPKQAKFLGKEPDTPEYYSLLKEYWQIVYAKFKENGIQDDHLRFYIYDEPTVQEIPFIKKVGKIIREVSPKIKIWGAIYLDGWKAMDDETKMLIDQWCMPYKYYTPDFLKWAAANKRKLIACFNCGTQYPYPTLFIDAPILAPRVISWINWNYGINIIQTWHTFNSVNRKDPYEHPATFSTYNGDGVLLYPSGEYGKSPWTVTSIRVEMLRRGMEDYEYLKMLSDLALKCKNSTMKKNAEDLLKEASSLVRSAIDYDRNSATYRIMKTKMGDMIERLYSK